MASSRSLAARVSRAVEVSRRSLGVIPLPRERTTASELRRSVSFYLNDLLVEEVRDAATWLSTAPRDTGSGKIYEIVERALQSELARLRAKYRNGARFPERKRMMSRG